MSDNPNTFWSDHHPPDIAVIGVGNVLLKDEGIGVHVIRALHETTDREHNEFLTIDGGTCPDVFFFLPEKLEKLIIVDAVKGGDKPGSVYRFTPDDIEFKTETCISIHQLGLYQYLESKCHFLHIPEDVVIFGIEPKEIAWGLTISPELEEKIPSIIELIMNEIENFIRQKLT